MISTSTLTCKLQQLIFRYKLTEDAAVGSDFSVHGIVLYEDVVVIDKVGDELVIV